MTVFTDYVFSIFGEHDEEAVQELLLTLVEQVEDLVGTDVHVSSQRSNDDNESFYSVKAELITAREELVFLKKESAMQLALLAVRPAPEDYVDHLHKVQAERDAALKQVALLEGAL